MTDPTQAEVPAGKLCDFYLGDCQRCGRRAERDNQQEPCARPNGPFSPSTAVQGAGEANREVAEDAGTLPWGYGWYDDGGQKHAQGYLPTVDRLRDVSTDAFPLYRHPPALSTSPAPASVADEARAKEAAKALGHVADALREVHTLGREGVNDAAFDASMLGQIAACERGAALLFTFAARPAGEDYQGALQKIERLTQPWGESPSAIETVTRIGEIARAALATEGTRS